MPKDIQKGMKRLSIRSDEPCDTAKASNEYVDSVGPVQYQFTYLT